MGFLVAEEAAVDERVTLLRLPMPMPPSLSDVTGVLLIDAALLLKLKPRAEMDADAVVCSDGERARFRAGIRQKLVLFLLLIRT